MWRYVLCRQQPSETGIKGSSDVFCTRPRDRPSQTEAPPIRQFSGQADCRATVRPRCLWSPRSMYSTNHHPVEQRPIPHEPRFRPARQVSYDNDVPDWVVEAPSGIVLLMQQPRCIPQLQDQHARRASTPQHPHRRPSISCSPCHLLTSPAVLASEEDTGRTRRGDHDALHICRREQ